MLDIYQALPISTHGLCKYTPTCSEYAKEAITKYGVGVGLKLTIKRILRCNPFTKGGYDPVPNLKK